MNNLKLIIEYNGSQFFGWQVQKDKRTVQGELEEAFFKLCGQNVEIVGSGRTDKGVHAIGQVASVKFENSIPLKNLQLALNNLLPKDIVVKKIEKVNDDFNARFSAKKKTYRYTVSNAKIRNAIDFDRMAFYSYAVDLSKMKEAAKILIGKHNFKAFASADAQVNNFEREIFDIKITKKHKIFKFDITGNGFLYNMVRIIVGTILEAGRGRISLESVQTALETGDRNLTGITMPANGLCLLKVKYDS